MTRPVAMARFDLAWPLAGALAAGLSAVVLGALAAARGLPVWMPLNATSHGLHGPQAASVTALDLAHTGLGAAIHVGSSFFWAAVAVFLLRRAASGDMRLAWLAGLATATIAGLVDYGLMPARLRPGWELVLPPLAVVAGLVALGVGLSLGLAIAHSIGRPARGAPDPAKAGTPAAPDRYDGAAEDAAPADMPDTAVEQLRHPAPHVLDQRQQRVDPAGAVTADPNRQGNGNKQPGDPRRPHGPEG